MVAVIGGQAHADGELEPPCPAPPPAVVVTTIGGIVRDAATNEPIAGATVIVTQGEHIDTAITDEPGTFTIPVAPGTYDVAVYVGDQTWTQHVEVAAGQQVTLVAELRQGYDDPIGCYFGPPPIRYVAEPIYGLDVTRAWTPVARDRTARAWIEPVADADPDRAITTLGGGHRLAGGLGVPLAFVEEVAVRTRRAPASIATGTGGGAAIALIAGANDTHGEARAIAGSDREGTGEAVVRGPIVTDKAWFATGLVAHAGRDGRIDGDALARFDVAPSADHQLAIAGLAQARAAGGRDDWADAAWTSKLDDHRLELHAGATAEELVVPADAIARTIGGAAGSISRVGGRASIEYRLRAAGYHHLEAGTELGGGTTGATRHADAVVFAGDSWDLEPNLKLEAAVRGELRRFGDARASVTAPRVAAEWDPTKEGRAGVFVAYERTSRLDDGALGAWRDAPRFHDEVSAGADYEPLHHDWIVVGAAARVRWLAGVERAGADGWMRIRRERLLLHASATSLDRAATIMARRTFGSDDELLDVSIGARIDPTRREAVLGAGWQHRGHATLKFDTRLEALTGDLGPTARLVLAARF